jgi:hypothetical protein
LFLFIMRVVRWRARQHFAQNAAGTQPETSFGILIGRPADRRWTPTMSRSLPTFEGSMI